jgi:phosphoenolpyruvate carboxykinase (ATP)
MNIFKSAAKRIYEEARRDKRLIEGRSLEELKRIALRQDGVIQTRFGSVAADSEPMNRSAPHTRNSVDHPFGEAEEALARQAIDVLGKERVISLDTIVGDGLDGVTVRFLIPEAYAQVAYGLKLLFDRPEARVVDDPTYTIIYLTDEHFEANKTKKLKDKDITIRLFMGDRRGDLGRGGIERAAFILPVAPPGHGGREPGFPPAAAGCSRRGRG